MPFRVMLVEDDPGVRASLEETLTEEGVEVVAVDSAESALARVSRADPDLLLSDVRMPGLSGLELLKEIRARVPSVDVVLMTAYEDMPTVAEAMREGAADFLVKPLELAKLRRVLGRVQKDREARSEVAARDAVPAGVERLLVGRDPAMVEVYKLIGRIASGRVNALIRGETGTGKELVARAIHESSAWAEEPFVPVNCTALPETLLESELFGHVEGSFTGATADRRGRFALARRGTLFLDEIGDTSPAFQAKLLRVLEDGSFHPVGSERAETTDARVLAATHRDLEKAVDEGDFREDLYYRLRVLEVRIPPLRDRLGDLPELARHLIERIAGRIEQPVVALTDEAVQRLLAHEWPGNVRELEHCLTRAVVMATGGVIRPEHLGLDGEGQQGRTDGSAWSSRGGRADGGDGSDADEAASFPTLHEIEGRHVQRALVVAGGNKTRAAELLGVSKPTLYRMLKRHELG